MNKKIKKQILKATKSNAFRKYIMIGAALAAVAAVTVTAVNVVKKRRMLLEGTNPKNLPRQKNVYIAGNSISALAAAAYLIKDGGFSGKCIHIYGMPKIVPSEEYGSIGSCAREFLRDIKASDDDMYIDALLENIAYAAEPKVKITDADGNVKDVSLKPSKTVLKALAKAFKKLSSASAQELSSVTAAEYFKNIPGFASEDLFKFVEMTFGLRLDNKASEFLLRARQLAKESPKAGLYDTLYYDFSILNILRNYLEENGAIIHRNAEITGLETDNDRVSAIHLTNNGTKMTIYLNNEDFFILDTGSIEDGATEGGYESAAPIIDEKPNAMRLWQNAADKCNGFGMPELLYADVPAAMEFSIVDDDGYLLEKICDKIGEKPDNGLSVLLEASNWRMKLTSEGYPTDTTAEYGVAKETLDQAIDTTSDTDEADITDEDINAAKAVVCESAARPILTVKGIYTGSEGNYVDKTMRECTGVEMLYELCCHLDMKDDWDETASRIKTVTIECMPYKYAPLMKTPAYALPKLRPCANCVVVSEFTEADAPSGTIERNMRTARQAAYEIIGKNKRPRKK